MGLPLICVAYGANERGRPRVAKGWLALGQFAVGVVVIAQFGIGFVALGQVALGIAAAGQLAAGLLTGIDQVAIGTYSVGQLVIGFTETLCQELQDSNLGVSCVVPGGIKTNIHPSALFCKQANPS